MRQREVRHAELYWAPRACADCGITFDPREGRDPSKPGSPRKRCHSCHGYKPVERRCARCSAVTTGSRYKNCGDCRPIVLAERLERERQERKDAYALKKAKKPDCSVCGVEKAYHDWTTCRPCGSKARKRQQSRLREFRERLFTTLVHTPEDVEFILALLDSPCEYCGSTTEITIEHRLPLIRGGSHTKDNLTAACKSCNSSKQDMTVEEWQENRLRI